MTHFERQECKHTFVLLEAKYPASTSWNILCGNDSHFGSFRRLALSGDIEGHNSPIFRISLHFLSTSS